MDVLVRNLSTTGALLEAEGELAVGTLVSLGIAGAGTQFARVTREAPAGVAVEFMVPLDPRAVATAKHADTLVSVAFPQISVQQATTAIEEDARRATMLHAPVQPADPQNSGPARAEAGRHILAIGIAALAVLLLYLAF